LPAAWIFFPKDHQLYLASLHRVHGRFWEAALGCFALGMLIAIPCVMLARSLNRRLQLPNRLLLALSIAGGCIGNVGLLFFCPSVNISHLLFGHATIYIGTVVGCILLFRFSLSSSSKSPSI